MKLADQPIGDTHSMGLRAKRTQLEPCPQPLPAEEWGATYPAVVQNDPLSSDDTTRDCTEALWDEDTHSDNGLTEDLTEGTRDRRVSGEVVHPNDPNGKPRASGPRRRIALTREEVHDALERRYRADADWESLIDLYRTQAEATTQLADRSELYKRVAQILDDEMDDVPGACTALSEAFAADRNDDETIELLQAIVPKLDDKAYVNVLGVLEAKASSGETDSAARSEFNARFCKMARDQAGLERAITMLRDAEPANAIIHADEALARREMGDIDGERESLHRALLSARFSVDLTAIHSGLAQSYEREPKNLARAKAHYESAYELDPADLDTMRALERIYGFSEEYAKLGAVLEALSKALTVPAERARALLKLASVQQVQFLKPELAAASLEQLLEALPAHEQALEALERCYRARRDWPNLSRTLQRRAELAKAPETRAALWLKLGETLEMANADLALAVEAYENGLSLLPRNTRALQALARLHEKQGNWKQAAGCKVRLSELSEDMRNKARLLAQAGDLLAPSEREPEKARLYLEKAVLLDADNLQAWELLQRLAFQQGDEMHAAHCLEQRAEKAQSGRLRAQLWCELARLRAEHNDSRGENVAYENAFRADHANEHAAKALLESFISSKRWTDASQACDLLVRVAIRNKDDEGLVQHYVTAAFIATALGNDERALAACLAALDIKPNHAAARTALLESCHRLRATPAALTKAKARLNEIAADTADLTADSVVRIGELRLAMNDQEAAIGAFRAALALDPGHARALNALADVYSHQGDHTRACSCKQRLAFVTEDPELRFGRLLEVAELWEKKAGNLARASLALEDALLARPNDPVVLGKLVEVYSSIKLWEKVVETLLTLANAESDPEKKARSFYAAAQVLREKMNEPRRAIHYYDLVLNTDPERLEAFERLVRCLTEQKDWNELRTAYCKMIARLRDTDAVTLRHALYHQVGLVYRDRLGDLARALDAFRSASRLCPENDEDRHIVVELLLVTGQLEQAIAEMRQAIRRDPVHPGAYRELYDLYLRAHAFDKAWCVASALRHLKDSDPGRARFLKDFPAKTPANIPGTLAAPAWQSHIKHSYLDPKLTLVFRLLTRAAIEHRFAKMTDVEKEAALGPRLDPNESSLTNWLATAVKNAAEVLGMKAPALYVRETMTVPVAVAPALEPSLFVCPAAMAAVPREVVLYFVTKRMAELHPDFAARGVFQSISELKDLLLVVAKGVLAGAIKQGTGWLASLSVEEFNQLKQTLGELAKDSRRLDVKTWIKLVDLSVSRAALLVVGDIEIAWRATQLDSRSPADLSPQDWRKEMLVFSVTDKYAELRGAIGVGVPDKK